MTYCVALLLKVFLMLLTILGVCLMTRIIVYVFFRLVLVPWFSSILLLGENWLWSFLLEELQHTCCCINLLLTLVLTALLQM